MATPNTVSPLERALLAYDGSLKSREGLYIAAYFAGKWEIPLAVVCLSDDERLTRETLAQAREYLDRCKFTVTYLERSSPVAEAILEAGETYGCDFFIMGGYGLNPVMEVVLGGTVDQVLRESNHPVLICR